jgi:hypothetical protein
LTPGNKIVYHEMWMGHMVTSFPLFTSIKPPADSDELSYLHNCLDSWRAAGFDAVAVNGPTEIEALRRLNLPIEFSPLGTNGKPRIGGILSAIRDSGAQFAGIINSDCALIGYPNMVRNLQAGLAHRLAIAWRIDVDGSKADVDQWGFDAFFFDTEIMPRDDCGFCIGEAWWDRWFPAAYERMGGQIEPLGVPLLVHRAHPSSWWPDWENNGSRLWEWTGKPGTPSRTELHRWGGEIQARLHELPQTICLTGWPETDSALRFAWRSMQEFNQLVAMRNSVSWRVKHHLLRGAIDFIRSIRAYRSNPPSS